MHQDTYLRNPELIATDMDGETVMMSLARGEYFGLGGVGGYLWELLAVPHSLDELVDSVCAEFEVDEARGRADLEAFLAELLKNELIAAS